MGTMPLLGARLARLTVQPRPAALRRRGVPAGRHAGARRHRAARGLAALPQGVRRRRRRHPARRDGREPGRPVRQPEHLLPRPARPADPADVRRARRAGQHRQPPHAATGSAGTRRGCSSSGSTSSRASATTAPARPLPRPVPGRHQPGRPRLRDAGPRDADRVGAPGRDASTRCRPQTGFPLVAGRRARRPASRPTRSCGCCARCSTRRACRDKEVPGMRTALTELVGVRAPDRADRHGLGGRARGSSRRPPRPAGSASWPAPR